MNKRLLLLTLRKIIRSIESKKLTLIDLILDFIIKKIIKLKNTFKKINYQNFLELAIVLICTLAIILILYLLYKYFLPSFINGLRHICNQLFASINAECGSGMSCLGDRSPQNSPDSGMKAHNDKLKEQSIKHKEAYEYDAATAKNTVVKNTAEFLTGAVVRTLDDIDHKRRPSVHSAIKGGLYAVAASKFISNPLNEQIDKKYPRKEGERPNTGSYEENND